MVCVSVDCSVDGSSDVTQPIYRFELRKPFGALGDSLPHKMSFSATFIVSAGNKGRSMSPLPTNTRLGKRKRDADVPSIGNEPATTEATGLDAQVTIPPGVDDWDA